ncbi:MAG: hypothetical protein M8353_00880 [ANME-2 cluster archaeon]|nr:hypothetical protein [ANME-2 cluster archaeon]
MQGKIVDFFSGKERKKVLEKLQYLDKKIPLVTLVGEKQKFEHEKQEIRDRLYHDTPVMEVAQSVDELIAEVESHLDVQENEDYSLIIEHLATKNIDSEADIKEILDPMDRQIVFQHVQLKKKGMVQSMLENLRKDLALVEQLPGRMYSSVSDNEDAEELRSVWNYLLQDEQDKLDDVKQRIDTSNINEIGLLEQEVVFLHERFTCLEHYVADYMSERALGALTREVSEYMPKKDVTCKDIYKGLGEAIVTELKGCTGEDRKEKMIKKVIAKLIYGRLKKGMVVK